MDERARLAIGGSVVVATSAAVVLFVALTNAAALTDSPGASIGESAVLVPSPSPSTPDADEASTPPPADGVPITDAAVPPPAESVDAPASDAPASGTVTVPAPEPVVVAPPAAQGPEASAPSYAQEEEFIAVGAATGSWAAAIEWARSQGWDEQKVIAWIERLQQRVQELRREGWSQGLAGRRAELQHGEAPIKGGWQSGALPEVDRGAEWVWLAPDDEFVSEVGDDRSGLLVLAFIVAAYVLALPLAVPHRARGPLRAALPSAPLPHPSVPLPHAAARRRPPA